MKCLWILLLFDLRVHADYFSAKKMTFLIKNAIKDTHRRVSKLSVVWQDCQGRAPFEIGYLMQGLQDKYRRMVDKFHMLSFMRYRLFATEYVLILEEIELLYWDIEHYMNMLHEIERKYQIKSGLDEDYEVITETTVDSTRPKIIWRTTPKRKQTNYNSNKRPKNDSHHHYESHEYPVNPNFGNNKTDHHFDKYDWNHIDGKNYTKKPSTEVRNKTKWPIEYGWEIGYDW